MKRIVIIAKALIILVALAVLILDFFRVVEFDTPLPDVLLAICCVIFATDEIRKKKIFSAVLWLIFAAICILPIVFPGIGYNLWSNFSR